VYISDMGLHIKHGSSAVESISISSYFLASTPTMRSIIVCTVVLVIAGLIHAQNRRLMGTFDLSRLGAGDLAVTDMGPIKATAFIDEICQDNSEYTVHAAINVENNETMSWDNYREGPGVLGSEESNYAIYPWSTVEGTCEPLLTSSWVTDREVISGPVTKNTNWQDWTMPVSIVLVTPKTNITTTLSSWEPNDSRLPAYFRAEFFDKAEPKNTGLYLGYSMLWYREDDIDPYDRRIVVPACTQTWLSAVSVSRTIMAVNSFRITSYNWETRGTGSQEGVSDTWMDVVMDNRGIVGASSTGWQRVYSSAGYVRVDGLCMLSPGGTMIVQIMRQELPPQNCHG
jgi:hypothetical protein